MLWEGFFKLSCQIAFGIALAQVAVKILRVIGL